MISLFLAEGLSIDAVKGHRFPLLEVLETLSGEFKMVLNFEAADWVVIPVNIQYLFLHGKKMDFEALSQRVKESGKQLLLFSGSDYGMTFKEPHITTVRLGGFASKMNPKTFIMPPFIGDPYDKLGMSFSVLDKISNPTIGFVGHSNGTLIKWLKEFALWAKGNFNRIRGNDYSDLQSFYPSSRKRYNYLEALTKYSGITTNFIYRKQYRAGAVSQDQKERTTLEFYQNVHDNMYTFCMRGTGNFSVRLYETLAMGRIPVLVNTNGKLPFENTIPWEQHALIIEEQEISQLPMKLVQFHQSKSDIELKEIQSSNRVLWQNYLRKEAFFRTLIQRLKE